MASRILDRPLQQLLAYCEPGPLRRRMKTLSIETHWREYADLQLEFDKLKLALTSGRCWAIPTTLNCSC